MNFLKSLPILLLFSCSHSDLKKTKGDKDQEKDPVIQKRIVGRIASVSSTGSFVLIQKYGTGTLPKDAIFQSQGNEGRQASLRPSGERVRDFFAADLINGTAKIGDAVLAYHPPSKKTEPTADKIPPEQPEEPEEPEEDSKREENSGIKEE